MSLLYSTLSSFLFTSRSHRSDLPLNQSYANAMPAQGANNTTIWISTTYVSDRDFNPQQIGSSWGTSPRSNPPSPLALGAGTQRPSGRNRLAALFQCLLDQ